MLLLYYKNQTSSPTPSPGKEKGFEFPLSFQERAGVRFS
jgi:hypothetical protein